MVKRISSFGLAQLVLVGAVVLVMAFFDWLGLELNYLEALGTLGSLSWAALTIKEVLLKSE